MTSLSDEYNALYPANDSDINREAKDKKSPYQAKETADNKVAAESHQKDRVLVTPGINNNITQTSTAKIPRFNPGVWR